MREYPRATYRHSLAYSAKSAARCYCPSPLGTIRIESEGDVITSLRFVESEPDLTLQPATPALQEAVRWLECYFQGREPDFLPHISLRGTPFQQSVWQQVAAIPYGATCSYGDIARRLGTRSAQAVGQAVGANPVCLIVPCHRVVGANGTLTGYAYGLERKRALLLLERRGFIESSRD